MHDSSGRAFYVVGGFGFGAPGEEVYYANVWKFDVHALRWSQLQLKGPGVFKERNRCQLALIDQTTLMVHGGNLFENHHDIFLGDVTLVDLNTGSVKLPPNLEHGTGAARCVGHHALIPTNNPRAWLIHGGENGVKRFADILVLSVEARPAEI
mmetsp:Transcript_19398/g.35673  ORF Transcript_19398/g.35673 Transcript_19398/m.35673 type:complete len:153 (+) Transcript_19398:685-1143(+)